MFRVDSWIVFLGAMTIHEKARTSSGALEGIRALTLMGYRVGDGFVAAEAKGESADSVASISLLLFVE